TYVDEVPPPGANIVSGMWIFRVKRPPGSPPVFKVRYVARGFSQRQGVEYFQTFSPTSKMTTLWVLLHVAAQRDYELHSLDFSTAFLQGSLHEEIWLRRPPGFTGSFLAVARHSEDYTCGSWVCSADPSLFLRTDALLPPFYILVYVDDLVFATADTAGLAHVKSELQKRHTCTDLGELRSYLGLQIIRDRARRTITLTQSHMVQQVLQRFDFTYSSPQATPLSTRHSLSALPSDESVDPSGPYPELVGCLMYLMTCTRPDLAYPLIILARYVAPGRHRPEHMAAAKRVLRYLCSTSGMGLVLGGRSPVVLSGHADASWVDDLATQRSSSCEAEIYAGAMAAQELRWLKYLLTDLGEVPRSPPVLYVDNKAMLALCREHRLEHRTKHIALRYFLAHELQQRGQLCLAYVASQANTADIFTKALQPCDHQRFCTMLVAAVAGNRGIISGDGGGGGAAVAPFADTSHRGEGVRVESGHREIGGEETTGGGWRRTKQRDVRGAGGRRGGVVWNGEQVMAQGAAQKATHIALPQAVASCILLASHNPLQQACASCSEVPIPTINLSCAQRGLHLGIEKHYNAWKIFDVHSKETVAARDVIFYERLTLQTYPDNLAAERDLTGGFRGNRAFALPADEADWDEQNVDGASEEAGPLPYCSVPIPMDDENPRESINAEVYYDFVENGYVTPQLVNTNVSERIGPNFLPDLEAGDEAIYPEDPNLPRYTQSGLQILGLVTAVHGTPVP
ncbi:unnamed protein product, partial [Closterium sp. NIES-53]